ncbi:MAG: extensin family protein [Rhodobacteraceae bacterium]|nr:extensin family protein [Paracoccaceae bacterium]
MKRLIAVALLLLAGTVLTGPVLAAAPETSLRPTLRGGEILAALPTTPSRLRPVMRAPSDQMVSMAAQADLMIFAGLGQSLRPALRPPAIVEQAMAKRRARRKGAICDNVEIQGEKVGHVPGRIKGCGFKQGVSVRSISGVKLSQSATMDCTTAKALNEWVDKSVIPAFKNRGGVVQLRVAAHYACRTRNNQPGARISEHGKGRAIDISAFTMQDGNVITVAGDWGNGKNGKALAQVHKNACGPFGTVLGPKADRYHRDHFHLDTASYRSGSYCR